MIHVGRQRFWRHTGTDLRQFDVPPVWLSFHRPQSVFCAKEKISKIRFNEDENFSVFVKPTVLTNPYPTFVRSFATKLSALESLLVTHTPKALYHLVPPAYFAVLA
jgi:hypothetical protein